MKKTYDIVEMISGKYALRKTTHWSHSRNDYEYKEVNSMSWWSADSNVQNYCLTKNLTKLRKELEFYRNYSTRGKVIEDDFVEEDESTNLANIMKPIPPMGRTITTDISNGLKNFFKFPALKVRFKK